MTQDSNLSCIKLPLIFIISNKHRQSAFQTVINAILCVLFSHQIRFLTDSLWLWASRDFCLLRPDRAGMPRLGEQLGPVPAV